MITDKFLSDNQYYKEETKKTTIVIHHTAGSASPLNVIHGWDFNVERVATAFVIGGKADKTGTYTDGQIFRAFDEKYWAHHIGCKTVNNTILNKQSIGIEVCNWGQLVKRADGEFLNYVNRVVPKDEVVELSTPHKGFKYYHKYTDAQLNSLKQLLLLLINKYNISKTNLPNIFELSKEALDGKAGVWSHNSYRADKVDMYPHPQLINLLKNL